MLKVWISGANGHLGQALCTRLDREKYQLIATDVAEVDVTVPAEVRAFADANRPDVIINCTGFNDEDGCETDPDRAYRVNALAPRNLALAADALGAKMVQFSTDDVFAKARATTPIMSSMPPPLKACMVKASLRAKSLCARCATAT